MVKKTRSESTNFNQHIINVVAKANPQTVEQLIKLLQSEQTIRRQEILDAVMELQRQGRITLKQPKIQSDFTLTEYILSAKGYWYLAIIALSTVTALLVFTIPENAYPIVYSRYILGSIFVLWLPGYSLIKVLFPTKKMDTVERIALSIGMSLASVSIVGLFLNYTPWGIRATSITLSLFALTFTFSTLAVIRDHTRPLDSTEA